VKNIVIGLVLAIVLILGVLFFKKKDDFIPLDPVKIGIVLPLSGDFEIYGKMGVNGAKMAVEEINLAGGVLGGRKLELIINDDKTDPNISVSLTKEMIEKHQVIAVMGSVSSTARDAMLEVCEKYKTPLLYGIDYEGGVFNRYLFCYSTIPDHIVKPMVPYMMENHGKKFYIFGYDYIWPHKISDAIKKEVEALGGTIVGIEFTPFGVADFSQTLDKIKKSGADVLMLIQPGNDGFRFLKQFTEAKLKDKIKIVAFAADESYLQAVDRESLEGILSPVHFLSSLKKQETIDFVARHHKMYGDSAVVTFSTEAHYGLIKLFAKAIDLAGSDDKEKIINALENNLEIVLGNGPVMMRNDHHMNMNIVIAEYTAGDFIEKKNVGLIKPADQKALGSLAK